VSSVGSEASSAAASERLESLRHAAHIAVGSFSLARSEAREAVGSYAQVGARCGREGGRGQGARTHAYGCIWVHGAHRLPAPRAPTPPYTHTYIHTNSLSPSLPLSLSLSLCVSECVVCVSECVVSEGVSMLGHEW
jgi:hypothetical protein